MDPKRGGRSNRATTGPTYTVLYGGYHLIRGHNIYSLKDKAPRSTSNKNTRSRAACAVRAVVRVAFAVPGSGVLVRATLLECKVQLKAARLELGLGPVHRVDLKFLRRLPTPGGIWAVGGLHTVITLSSRSHQAPPVPTQPSTKAALCRVASRLTRYPRELAHHVTLTSARPSRSRRARSADEASTESRPRSRPYLVKG